jgi:hypothetical protein
MDEIDLGDVELIEHPLIINLKYRLKDHVFDMLYHKDKDKVFLLKNGEPCQESDLSNDEVLHFKEALEICISYHHNKENESLH